VKIKNNYIKKNLNILRTINVRRNVVLLVLIKKNAKNMMKNIKKNVNNNINNFMK